ncbi:hypothetical protein ABZ348_04230 [Streptomyces sp. NPDC005963]|uniref:hypothetical protein n=1 Tax=Streptomyces sp. NPDC005963 TaxID=3156721 RepID=UPI0033C88FBF
MAIDPTDPETLYEAEREAAETTGPDATDTTDAADITDADVPEADAAEQESEVRPEHDDPVPHIDKDHVNEADAVEQARVVALDEDDYR